MDFTPLLETSDRIDPMDVRNFRSEVFSDGLVSIAEAEAVFAINASVLNKCEEWNEFFVESVVDYLVHLAQPRGYVSVANCEWLISQIDHDGRVESASELELLVKVIERATQCPQSLSVYTLEQIEKAVLEGNGQLIGDQSLSPGIIGAAEVELIRRVLYAYGGDSGLSITRAEAEILFNLNDRTIEEKNHPSWSDLFMKAVANHLMAVSGYQTVDRTAAIKREEWLNQSDSDVQGMLANSLRSIGDLFSKGGLADLFKSDLQREEDAWENRNRSTEQAAEGALAINQGEGEWLANRIGRDGRIHDNEKALLNYIRDESLTIHPAIQSLIDKVA